MVNTASSISTAQPAQWMVSGGHDVDAACTALVANGVELLNGPSPGNGACERRRSRIRTAMSGRSRRKFRRAH